MARLRNLHLILNDAASDSRIRKEVCVILSLLNPEERIEVAAVTRAAEDEVVELVPGVPLRRFRLSTGGGGFGKLVTAINLVRWVARVYGRYCRCPGMVIYVHHAELLPLACLLKWRTESLIVYVPHELECARAGQGRLKSLLIELLERSCRPFVASMVVVNRSIAAQYSARMGFPLSEVVENVPDVELAEGGGFDLRRILGIPSNRRICIYVGGFVKFRGIEQVLSWFKNYPQDEFALVFLGEGPLRGMIEAAAETLPVFLLPPVHSRDVVRFVSGADLALVLVEPVALSYYLCLPNKFFEAVVGKVPVLATKLPELEKLVSEYGLGVCIENRSAADFYDGCRQVCALSRSRFLDGREQMLKEHGWPVQREKIANVFSKVRAAIND